MGRKESNQTNNDECSRYCVGHAWPQGYKTFFMLNSAEHKLILLINVKMPTVVVILTIISMINTTSERLKERQSLFVSILVLWSSWKYVLSWVEHEKSFITSRPEACSTMRALRERSLYWCQALHITNKDRYQNNERSQTLALLNSRLCIRLVLSTNCKNYQQTTLTGNNHLSPNNVTVKTFYMLKHCHSKDFWII